MTAVLRRCDFRFELFGHCVALFVFWAENWLIRCKGSLSFLAARGCADSLRVFMSIFAKKKSVVWIVLGLAGARFFKGTDDWKKSVMRTQGWLRFMIF